MYWPTLNVTRPLDVFTYMNTVTNNLFWTVIVFAIFIMIYLALSTHNFKNAILPALFISTFTSAILLGVGLVDTWLPSAMMVTCAIAALWVYLAKAHARP